MVKTAFASPGDEDTGRKNDAIIAELEIMDRPNFYAVLPAHIRYSDKLTWLEKILYAEITALSNKDGHCFATNSYFSKHYKVSERTVRRAITNLTDIGFLFTLYESHGDRTHRKIYLRERAVEEIPMAVIEQSKKPEMRTNLATSKKALDKNVPHNNTIGYRTIGDSINTNTTPPPSEACSVCPAWMGKTPHSRLGKLYELLWEHTFGVPHKLNITGTTGAILKRLLAEYPETMVALFLVVHFEWRGMSGSDNRLHQNLKDNGFPLAWLSIRAETYKSYIIGQMKLDTDEKQAVAVRKAIDGLVSNKS